MRSRRANEGAARSVITHRRDRKHTLSQIVPTKAARRGIEEGRWPSKRLWIGCAKERYAARKRGCLRCCWLFTGFGRRRRWSDEDKARMVAEIAASVNSVCSVARRHGLSPRQLFDSRDVSCEKPRTIIPKRKKYGSRRRVSRRSNFGRRMTIHFSPVPPVTLASVPGAQATAALGGKMTNLADLLAKISASERNETLAPRQSRKGR
jgi:transposase-like protein